MIQVSVFPITPNWQLEKELTVLRAKVAAAEKLAAEFAIASEFFAGPPFVHLHGDTPLKRSIAALAAFRAKQAESAIRAPDIASEFTTRLYKEKLRARLK